MAARFFTRCAGARNRRFRFLEMFLSRKWPASLWRMPGDELHASMNRPARPQVKATVGGNTPSQVGMDALLDFRMEVTLDGEKLSAAEIKRLLAHS